MIKDFDIKRVNFYLEHNGYARISTHKEVQRSLGNEYVRQPIGMGSVAHVKLKRINSVVFGGS